MLYALIAISALLTLLATAAVCIACSIESSMGEL